MFSSTIDKESIELSDRGLEEIRAKIEKLRQAAQLIESEYHINFHMPSNSNRHRQIMQEINELSLIESEVQNKIFSSKPK